MISLNKVNYWNHRQHGDENLKGGQAVQAAIGEKGASGELRDVLFSKQRCLIFTMQHRVVYFKIGAGPLSTINLKCSIFISFAKADSFRHENCTGCANINSRKVSQHCQNLQNWHNHLYVSIPNIWKRTSVYADSRLGGRSLLNWASNPPLDEPYWRGERTIIKFTWIEKPLCKFVKVSIQGCTLRGTAHVHQPYPGYLYGFLFLLARFCEVHPTFYASCCTQESRDSGQFAEHCYFSARWYLLDMYSRQLVSSRLLGQHVLM